MAPFYGWGSTASRLESLRGGSLLFTTKFPEIYLFKVRCVRASISAFGINYKMFLFKQLLQDSQFMVYLYHSFSFASLERTP